MNSFLSLITDAGNLLLVVLGFSLIIVIHELGHFLAARWAGIRVLAFAVGFGPALISFRKGLGWRRGSSEPEYRKIAGDGTSADRTASVTSVPAETGAGISPTEYRLNVLPFGGYVKMLGQDDIDPTARSSEPDSYQNCKTWKRMIVISAGVTANIITAAILFVVVFMLGLKTEPAKIGFVEPGSPAATTMATNAQQLGVTTPGLRPGDHVVAIDGEKTLSFQDITLASAMARAGRPIHIDVRRRGVPDLLKFAVVPVEMPVVKMLYIGAAPASSNQLRDPTDPVLRERFRAAMASAGVPGIEPGMRLLRLDGREVVSAFDLADAADRSQGQPVEAVFTDDSGREVKVQIPSRARLMSDKFMIDSTEAREARHLLGLMPVLAVEDVSPGDGGDIAGLKPGDVFVRIGAAEWPSVPTGVAEIRSAAGSTIRIVVARKNEAGVWDEVDLGKVKVSTKGTIGFTPTDSSALGAWIGTAYAKTDMPWTPPQLAPGTRILSVNGQATPTLLAVREELRKSSLAHDGNDGLPVKLAVQRPLLTADGSRPIDEVEWTIPPNGRDLLVTHAWEPALDPGLFQIEQIELRAEGPISAIGMGLRETHRVMMTTYITFARLFQGSIKVSHLKGPVGIAHAGTILADRGFVWLLFFMALISVNLAVINFLPIPIADGGHFVFLLYEQITGKPVSAAIQNFAAIAGLVLLATVFLIVTFHDISNLFRG